MIRNQGSPWLWVLAVLVILSTVPGLAQQEGETDEGTVDEEFMETEARPEIEEFLEDDMEVLAGEGATYEPGDRRDPFRSLVTLRQSRRDVGPRPEGIRRL